MSRKVIAAILAGIAAATLLIVGISTAAADDSVAVTLKSKNNSGISGTATYGDSRVTGKATGMDPSQDYYSFVYGAGSDSDGDNPCILTGETLAGPVNTIGKWKVDSNGNGTLNAPSPVDPDDAGTMSIRRDDSGTGGLAGPLPINGLVACGNVGANQDTALGRVQDQLPQLPNVPGPKVVASNPTSAVSKAVPTSTPRVPALSGQGLTDDGN